MIDCDAVKRCMWGQGPIAAYMSDRDTFVAMEIPERLIRRTETMGGPAVSELRIMRGTVSSWSDEAPTRTCGTYGASAKCFILGGPLRASEVCHIGTCSVSRPLGNKVPEPGDRASYSEPGGNFRRCLCERDASVIVGDGYFIAGAISPLRALYRLTFSMARLVLLRRRRTSCM